MKLNRAYKFKMEPNAEQTEKLYQFAGARRFIYNWGLARRIEVYKATGKGIKYAAQNLELTELKRQEELSWLKETDSQCLQESLRDVDRAFQNFFKKRAKYPKFKSRNAGFFSFRVPQRVCVEDGKVYCPKIGWIKIRQSQGIEGVTKSATFKRDACGNWFVTLVAEFEMPEVALPEAVNAVGIDMGLKDFIVLSNDERVAAPKFFRKAQKKLAKVQRKLSRATKGSSRRTKTKLKVAKVHRKTTNQRSDFIHKITSDLVKKYDHIGIENLNVKGMSKNHRLAKSIHDAGMGELRRQLEYKCLWNRVNLSKIDRWFPSSKMCGSCGEINKDLTLSDRVWLCSCGTFHDRDLNAAKNILEESLNVAVGHTETQNARGAAVRLATASAL